MKRILICLLLLFSCSVAQAKVMIIGDSLGTTCATGTSTSLYSLLVDYFDGDVWNPNLPCDTGYKDIVEPYDPAGYYSMQARFWAADGASCDLTNFEEARDCFDTAAAAGCDKLIIMGLLYNDLKNMYNATNFPNEIFSALDYLKSVITYAQGLGMTVTYVSGYPLGTAAWGEVGTGLTHTSCAGGAVEDCNVVRNENYHFCMTQLEYWLKANGADFIDFHSYRVATDTPDDAFITTYGNGVDTVHLGSLVGITEWYDFIVERLNKKVTFVGVKAQGGVNTNGF